jgi:hypothetical protein
MEADLKTAIKVPFAKIFLDPNNPRLASEDTPGYGDPSKIFTDDIQGALNARVKEVYDVDTLEGSVLTQGWVPIDAMIVWEHPKKPNHYIVLEGNTRTVVLRGIRAIQEREEKKLQNLKKHAAKYTAREIELQEKQVKAIKQIIQDTDKIEVHPVNAKTEEELDRRLKRLMSVRHIMHAQQWSPYALNLYILEQYQQLFESEHPKKDMSLMQDLVEQVGENVSLGATKTRRAIQAASAFSHFKRSYEDQLTDGDKFSDEDQYFFENILQNKYAADQLGFNKDDLYLGDEAEEVLFKWGFRHPRVKAGDSKNILRKAEDIRVWARMKRYDDEKGTSFAAGLDPEHPDDATPMEQLDAKFQLHKAQISPVDTLRDLLDSFGKLKADSLMTQAAHIRPMMAEVIQRATGYLAMIDAVTKKGAA